jgi:Rod binding domain-containing protein
MSLLLGTGPAASSPKDAAEKMEALLLQQLVSSANLFGKPSGAASSPGTALRGDLFAEALAEAVAKSGGVGIARLLDSSSPPLNRSGARVETLGEAPSDPRHV